MQEKRQEFDSEGLQRDHRGLSQLAQKGPWPLKQDLRSVKRKHGLLCIDISLPAGEVRNSGVEDKVHGQILRAEGLGNFIRVRFVEGDYDAGILAEFLSRGVIFESGEIFHFIGCSQSQLRDRSTIFMYKTKDRSKIWRNLLPRYGNFLSKGGSIAKKMKRLGLLFTDCPAIVSLDQVQVYSALSDITISDEKAGIKCFTDGCGLMSAAFAERAAKSLTPRRKSNGPVPSVIQIRHKGFKGVLMIDQRLEGCQIQFRGSMEKFESTAKLADLGIVDYSRPSNGTSLNKQIIMVLSELGISDDVLLWKQRQHLLAPCHPFLLLKWALINSPLNAVRMLSSRSNTDMAKAISDTLRRMEKLRRQAPKESLRIPLSRNVFGVADISGQLKYGQCFFRPTITGTPRTLTNGRIAVARNPCYYPGDVRVLEVVDIPELSHLVDCIVFPVEGPRPHAHEMAGGDLDGDRFFVTWDPDLVPSRTCDPYPYDQPPAKGATGASPPQSKVDNTADEMARYYADYYTRVGEIDFLFWQYAEGEGVNISESKACYAINGLFSQAVDMVSAEFNEELDALKKAAPTKIDDNRVWLRMQREKDESVTTPIRSATSEELFEFISNDPIGSLLRDEEIRQAVSADTWYNVIKAFRNSGKEVNAIREEIGRGHKGNIDLSRLAPFRASEISLFEFLKDPRPCEEDHRCIGYCRKNHSSAEDVVQKWLDQISQGETASLAEFEEIRLRPLCAKLECELERKREQERPGRDALSRRCKEQVELVMSRKEKLEGASQEMKSIENEISDLERKMGIVLAKKQNPQGFDRVWAYFAGPSKEEKKRKLEEDQLQEALDGKRQSLPRKNDEQQRVRRELAQAHEDFAKLEQAYKTVERKLSSLIIENEEEYKKLYETRSQFLVGTEHLRSFVDESLRVWHLRQRIYPVRPDALWELSERERLFRWWLQSRIEGALQRERIQFSDLLPIYTKKREIMRALEENQVLILSADPGSGKTTHVPPFLYDFEALSLSRLRRMANEIIAGTIRQSDIFPQPPSVACTQPRRFAVTSVHERVSEKFGSDEEGVVGYRMRGERSAPPAYRHRPAIEYMTDGILRFYISKGMKDFDAVMIDEVHERNINIDVNLALLRQVLEQRPELKLVITSATLDASRLKNFFSATTLKIEGKAFEVHDMPLCEGPRFLLVDPAAVSPTTTPRAKKNNRDKKGKEKIKEPAEEDSKKDLRNAFRSGPLAGEELIKLLDDDKECARVAVSACATLLQSREEKGDILVFLPGQADVLAAVAIMQELVRDLQGERVLCLPLYGALAQKHQDRARESAANLKCDRKIIFATNIAETSVTIDGIKFVLDSGREKVMAIDRRTGWPSLQLQPVTKSSVTQRRGRAGRTADGFYTRLYSDSFETQMQDQRAPEICRCDLASTLLDVLCREGKWLPKLEMIDPPPEATVRFASETLQFLEAIEMTGGGTPTLTRKGRLIAQLPFSRPQSAAMLIRASEPDLEVSEELAIIAVMMEVGNMDSLFKQHLDRERLNDTTSTQRDESGDHITMLHHFLTYRSIVKLGGKKRWCKQSGIDPRKMENITKQLNRTKQSMKKCNIPIIPCPVSIPSKEKEKRILRAVCAGDFLNLCSSNSRTSDKAGFSHVRLPARIGLEEEEDKTIDRALFLDKSTTIALQGEHLRSDLVIFSQVKTNAKLGRKAETTKVGGDNAELVVIPGKTYFNIASRVSEQLIEEEAPTRWKEVVWQRVRRDYLEERRVENVGPAVYDVVDSNRFRAERESGCIIHGEFKRGIFLFWGTKEEVSVAECMLRNAIEENRNALLAEVRRFAIDEYSIVGLKAGAVVCNAKIEPLNHQVQNMNRNVMCGFEGVTQHTVKTFLETFGALEGKPYFPDAPKQASQHATKASLCFATYLDADSASKAVSSGRPGWCKYLHFNTAVIWKVKGGSLIYEGRLEKLCSQLREEMPRAKITLSSKQVKIVSRNDSEKFTILAELGAFFGDTFLELDPACVPDQQFLLRLERTHKAIIVKEGTLRLRIFGLESARVRCAAELRAHVQGQLQKVEVSTRPLGRGDAPRIIGYRCKKIDKLRRRTGAIIRINHNEQMVSIRGTPEQVQGVHHELNRICQPIQGGGYMSCVGCGESDRFLIRASLCNHRFCYSCAKNHLALWIFDSEQLGPVCCVGCTDPLLVRDIEKILDREAQDWNRLLLRLYKKYLNDSGGERTPCTDPACPGVHDRSAALSCCSVCRKVRCMRCNRPAYLHGELSACPFQKHE